MNAEENFQLALASLTSTEVGRELIVTDGPGFKARFALTDDQMETLVSVGVACGWTPPAGAHTINCCCCCP